jgi:hypothetical protein
MITRESIMAERPCEAYPEARVNALVPPGGMTVRQVAEAAQIPAKDRHWVLVFCAGASDRVLREHACWCARQALARVDHPDPRSLAAVEVSERFARGEASPEELATASDAARYAARAAGSGARAAWAAYWAAYWAASWAAYWAAAWSAARSAWDAQMQDMAARLETT